MKQLLELVARICKEQHMGPLAVNPEITITAGSGVNKMRISWKAIVDGKTVWQYAEFKMGAICLEA